MKVFIAYRLKDKSKTVVERTIDAVAEKFSIKSLNERVPPHVTLKAPFEVSPKEYEVLDRFLGRFVRDKKRIDLEIGGIAQFGDYALVLSVHASDELMGLWNALLCELETFSFVSFSAHEGRGENVPHVTLAAKINRIIGAVRAYVEELNPPPLRETMEDMSVFEYRNKKWELLKEYKF